jgi:UDP-N-acetylglucosamine--N-acetylmuramyl-(pentapeptide) pyrophosphoryl-undecaprenol N-acetylglucosamine transferase
MSLPPQSTPSVALACGGTGGHLFPGLAVGEQLRQFGCAVTLLISPKDVDQQAVKGVRGMDIATLPAVGLTRGSEFAFVRGFIQSYRAARKLFKARAPRMALAMGGFTSAPPILAAKRSGAQTFLHESNTFPGRANRWLSLVVDRAFVGFPEAAARLRTRRVTVTGTPVRRQFQSRSASACRAALGLDPERPTVLVMGGSQGASGINDLLARSLPLFAQAAPELQWFHLTGLADTARLKQVYSSLNLRASVQPFFSDMEVALGAATVAVSRAGASSLAELAAVGVPAILLPYPAATDNHQFHNARAFEATGAARVLEQKNATSEELLRVLLELAQNAECREKMRSALGQWHVPNAARQIAQAMLQEIGLEVPESGANGAQMALSAQKASGLRKTGEGSPRSALQFQRCWGGCLPDA